MNKYIKNRITAIEECWASRNRIGCVLIYPDGSHRGVSEEEFFRSVIDDASIGSPVYGEWDKFRLLGGEKYDPNKDYSK